MDETEKAFMVFLKDSKTAKLIEKIAFSLSNKFKGYEMDDLQQIVFECLLEKREIWPRILLLPKPWNYIAGIVKNKLNNPLRSLEAESPGLYFRKRIVDGLKKSEQFRTFKDFKGKVSRMCYTLKSSVISKPLYLIPQNINDVPFDDRFTHPDITEIRKEKRMLEMASWFLEFWEKREGKNVSLLIDDLWMWIIKKVNIADVFESVSAEHQYRPDDLIGPGKKSDMRSEEMDLTESIGLDHSCDPASDLEIEIIIKKTVESLSERERACFRMRFENKTLEEIACFSGLKTASGVSEILKKSKEKIILSLESSGYSVNEDSEMIFKIMQRFFLTETLKNQNKTPY